MCLGYGLFLLISVDGFLRIYAFFLFIFQTRRSIQHIWFDNGSEGSMAVAMTPLSRPA